MSDHSVSVVHELVQRGWKVTNLHDGVSTITIAFELMGGQEPTWHKAVVIPALLLSPNHVERQMREWQDKVRREIAAGTPSLIVRRMIEAHGQNAVHHALAAPGVGVVH